MNYEKYMMIKFIVEMLYGQTKNTNEIIVLELIIKINDYKIRTK